MPETGKRQTRSSRTTPLRGGRGASGVILAWMLVLTLAVQGCFSIPDPVGDRDERVLEALAIDEERPYPPSPLSPEAAVAYALSHNLDIRVSEIEAAYQNESLVASRRRMLPSLTARYSLEHSNHPNARWSMSTSSGSQSLESSYSSEPNSHRSDLGAMWSILDFGVGYLKSRQQGERVRNAEEQRRRVRQQIVLDVLTHYWRATVAEAISRKAELLRSELEEQAAAIRDSVDMRILSQAEGARRELSVHSGLAELEQWRRLATQARLELARILGAGSAADFELAEFPDELPDLPDLPGGDPEVLQAAALRRRPELFQQDAQERIAVEEAKLAILQMAPNANLSLNLYHDPDKFLEWNNWMTVGARVSWNLFNIPARLSERRMAHLQKDLAHNRGLVLAAGIMAQVGIAYSDWKLSRQYAEKLFERAATRRRLVEALAAGEQDGQTRPGEVLMERVRLLGETAMAMRAGAEVRVAGARLANAVGLDVDADGRIKWDIDVDGLEWDFNTDFCDTVPVDPTEQWVRLNVGEPPEIYTGTPEQASTQDSAGSGVDEPANDTASTRPRDTEQVSAEPTTKDTVKGTAIETVTDTAKETAIETDKVATQSTFMGAAHADAKPAKNSPKNVTTTATEDNALKTAGKPSATAAADKAAHEQAGRPVGTAAAGASASTPVDDRSETTGIQSLAGLRVIKAEDFLTPDEVFDAKPADPETVSLMAPARESGSGTETADGRRRLPMTAVDLRSVLGDRKTAAPPSTEGPDGRSDRDRALELLPDITATGGASGNKGN
ncbi:MAG: TolC family protein [Planctomycetaceae bacterium]|nr:TolC family protein [Planctomycetaceae bacterium]